MPVSRTAVPRPLPPSVPVSSKPLHVPGSMKLPARAKWERLDDVCLGVFDCPHSTPELTATGPLVVRSQDIITGILRADSAAHVGEATYAERIVRAEPRHGDLLYSREGTYFGIAAEVPVGVRVCLGQRMVLIRPNPQVVYSKYLRYWLNSPVMASHIHGFRDGTVAERLNLPVIRALPMLLPPLPEQKAIAHILGALDDKIELNRRMNQTLEAMAAAIFKSWFVDFDPVRAKHGGRQGRATGRPSAAALCVPTLDPSTAALFPNTFQDSPLGPIPKGWRVGTVGDYFSITMGQSPPGESYNEIGEGMPFYQGSTDFGFRHPKVRVHCSAPTRFAAPCDTLVSVRAPVGDINMAVSRCCIGRGLAAVRHRSGSRSFTYYALQAMGEAFQEFEAGGTVFGCIGKTDFHNLPHLQPCDHIVAEFERVVYPLDQRISDNENEAASLAAMRDTLLPKLLSGEVLVGSAKLELDLARQATGTTR